MARKKKDRPAPKERPPLETYYDKDGTKIGDDGYPMTPVRTRMHTLFNALFIWSAVIALVGIGLLVASYFQNQEITSWELVYTGGAHFNGYSVATILRLESLLCFVTAFMCFVLNLFGFSWMYDRHSPTKTRVCLTILGAASLALEVAALATIHIPEPLAIINFVLIFLVVRTMSLVKAERPTLKKAKAVRKTVKTKQGIEEITLQNNVLSAFINPNLKSHQD